MNPRILTPLLAVAFIVVSGCDRSGGVAGNQAPASLAPNSVTMGTSGGTEPARADVSMNDAGQILMTVTSGPMKDMTFLCADANSGTCTVVAPPDLELALGSGTLLHRMHGAFAFVGNFNVRQLSDPDSGGLTQLVHSGRIDGPGEALSMPQGVASYTGQFRAGAGINAGPDLEDRVEGIAQGQATVLANFNSARLTVDLNGAMDSGEPIRAVFSGLTIDPATGYFASAAGATHEFQHEAAGGDMRGAFYGPQAAEAAGIFNIGSERHGGMSGIFLACKGLDDSCIRH